MRTTVTLEPDVEATLREVQRRTGMQRKSLINEALRRGLHDLDRSPEVPRPRYETVPFDPGVPALHGIHSVYDLLAFAEGEDFR